MVKPKKSDVVFLPLGGSGEIGMNVNLYHIDGKWLMIDLGLGFADDLLPGVNMIIPDLTFAKQIKDNLLGIVLTHAHEDHYGSVPHVWNQLRVPVYATPFTAAMLKSKLVESEFGNQVPVHHVQPGSAFNIGPFNLEMVQITHSIPEMNGIILRTPEGAILHTGDWKLDHDPVVGPQTDEDKLRALGEEGVLAMICDSTNAMSPGHSGSESGLEEHISGILDEAGNNLVIASTFASNVARMETFAKVAQRHNRQVVVSGRSMIRVYTAAYECGYLNDYPKFVNEDQANRIPREKQLVLCTGCQGERFAAVGKIASGNHKTIKLRPNDLVIFSSKIIPGNEKPIFRMFNQLTTLGVKLFTEKDHQVHVSGHPYREELKEMYDWVKPKIAVPVHGETIHMHHHAELAKGCGVQHTHEIQNGEMVRLSKDGVKSLGFVKAGYFGVDGKQYVDPDGNIMSQRRRMQEAGIVFAAITLNKKGDLLIEPDLHFPGLMDYALSANFIYQMAEDLGDLIESQRDTSEDSIIRVARGFLRKVVRDSTGKRPLVEISVTVI